MTEPITLSDLLTFEQYAKAKKISLKTVYNHIKTGAIVPITIGKKSFIRKKNDGKINK